jgi:hypothetical protein
MLGQKARWNDCGEFERTAMFLKRSQAFKVGKLKRSNLITENLMHSRRALLYMPGDDRRKMKKPQRWVLIPFAWNGGWSCRQQKG